MTLSILIVGWSAFIVLLLLIVSLLNLRKSQEQLRETIRFFSIEFIKIHKDYGHTNEFAHERVTELLEKLKTNVK